MNTKYYIIPDMGNYIRKLTPEIYKSEGKHLYCLTNNSWFCMGNIDSYDTSLLKEIPENELFLYML